MTEPTFIQLLRENGYEVFQTGSRAICKQPPEDSDDDWVVLDQFQIGHELLSDYLKNHDFQQDVWEQFDDRYGNAEEQFPIASWRRDKMNIIVTQSPRFFDLTKLATDIATRLNIKDRDTRVWLFHAIRHGVAVARD